MSYRRRTDPRTGQRYYESRLALRKSGVDVTLVRAVDEHHGFSKPWQQRIDALRLAFFEKYLKG